MKYLVLGLLGAVLAFAISLAVRLGAFKDIKIEITQEPELHLIYKEHMGAYHKIVPVIEEVEAWAKSHSIPCAKSFGEFLDNPEIVEEVRLRANAGCLVEKIPENLPTEIKSATRLSQSYIKVLFSGSPSIGPFKVYTPVQRLANEQRLKLLGSNLEIYEVQGTDPKADSMLTTYLFPFEK